MRNIYCISGLGADHRVFGKLHIPGFELVGVPWLQAAEDETLSSYAARMYAAVPEKDPIIIGLSFGGMLTTEIRRQFGISYAIIVSSAKTRFEIGFHNGAFAWLARRRFVSDKLFVTPSASVLFLLGANTKDEQDLLSSMLRSGDAHLNRWMVNALLSWDSVTAPQGVFHIHGTADRVIRPANVTPSCWVEQGGHFMIYNRADEVGKLIADYLLTSI